MNDSTPAHFFALSCSHCGGLVTGKDDRGVMVIPVFPNPTMAKLEASERITGEHQAEVVEIVVQKVLSRHPLP